MLQECMEVFRENFKQYSEQWILDNYVPKDGTYFLINIDNNFSIGNPIEIKTDRKTGKVQGQETSEYQLISFLDYYSKLIEMNKPVDSTKQIHSNNFYAFFVKKESLEKKLTAESISGYYEVLKNPVKKYSKSKDRSLYELVEEKLGKVDVKQAERIENWVKAELKNCIETLHIDTSKKDYLKIFFIGNDVEQSKENIKREGLRYIEPNIFNKNDYNQQAENSIKGLPSNNMSLNAKKPFLENKTRKTSVPYLLELDDAMMQMYFFDYLSGQAAKGKNNIYFDLDKNKITACSDSEKPPTIETGIYLRIQTGKELEIHYMGRITGYKPDLDRPFTMKEVLKIQDKAMENFEQGYGRKNKLWQVEVLVDDVLFSKRLKYNYFTNPEDLSFHDNVLKQELVKYREQLFSWFGQGKAWGIAQTIDNMSWRLIVHSIIQGNRTKATHQLNLWISMMDYFNNDGRYEENMSKVRDLLKAHIDEKEEWDFESADEYCYAVGQLMNTYLSLSKSANKNLSFINPLLQTTSNEMIKRTVLQIFKKYSYAITDTDYRIKNLYGHGIQYDMTGKEVNHYFLSAGFVDGNLVYTKREKEEQ